MSNKKAVAIIIIFGLLAYLCGLYSNEIIKIDIRYALFTSDMAKYGLGMFPTLNGQPYMDYPSLPVYLMYLASFKGLYVNMLTITLPSALAGILILVLIYLLGARVSKMLGAYAVLLSFLMYQYLLIVRSPSIDIYVAAATILSFYIVYTGDEDKKYKRLILLPFCFIFGFAMRGPIGSIIPSAVVFAYYLINKKWKLTIIFAIISGIVTLSCMTLWLYFCYLSGGKALLKLFFEDQFFSRFGGSDPIWYYVTNAAGSYAITYPLGLFVFIVYFKKIVKNIFHNNDNRLHFLKSVASWMIIVLFIFSLPGYKHLRYIVSAIPAAILMAAWIFTNFDNLKIFDKIKQLLIFVCRIGPFLALATVIIGTIVFKIIHFEAQVPYITASIIFLILGILSIYANRKLKNQIREFALLAIMTVTFVVIQITIAEKIDITLESSQRFVTNVESLKAKDNAKVCFFDFGPDGDDLKYIINIPAKDRQKMIYILPGYVLPQPTTTQVNKNYLQGDVSLQNIVDQLINMLPNVPDIKLKPMFERYNLSELSKLQPNTIFIAKKKDYNRELPEKLKPFYHVLFTGKMGHQDCVAFQKINTKQALPVKL